MIKLTKKFLVATLLFVFLIPSFSLAENKATEPSEFPVPMLREKKTREGYILDLKALIKKSKEKIGQVDERLKEQAQERRNEQREEKAREYYGKAMKLYDEGKFKEAQELWDKAIKITEHPEMKNYISQNAHKTKKMEEAFKQEENRNLKRLEIERGFSVTEVEKTYQGAVSLFKQKKYLSSKDEFERVDEMFPDHKATRSYLMIIDQEIQKEQQQVIAKNLKEDAQAHRKEREAWRANLEKKEKEKQQQLVNQAEVKYKEATILYKARQFAEAKDRFKDVEWILPNYKDTGRYLATVDQDIKNGEKKREHEIREARERELKHARSANLSQDELTRRQSEIEGKDKENRLNEEAEFVYSAAQALYNEKFYTQAKDKFLEVQMLSPNYKSTQKYLSRLKKDLASLKQGTVPIEEEDASVSKPVAATERKTEDLAGRFKKEEELMIKNAEDERHSRFEKEADSKYQEALSFYKQNRFNDAKIKFIQVEATYPNYRNTVEYLSRIDDDIEKQSLSMMNRTPEPMPAILPETSVPSQRESAETLQKKARKLYQDAVQYFKFRDYSQAREKFLEVSQLIPKYKKTDNYLKQIENKMTIEQKQSNQSQISIQSVTSNQSASQQPSGTLTQGEIERVFQQSELERKQDEKGRPQQVQPVPAEENFQAKSAGSSQASELTGKKKSRLNRRHPVSKSLARLKAEEAYKEKLERKGNYYLQKKKRDAQNAAFERAKEESGSQGKMKDQRVLKESRKHEYNKRREEEHQTDVNRQRQKLLDEQNTGEEKERQLKINAVETTGHSFSSVPSDVSEPRLSGGRIFPPPSSELRYRKEDQRDFQEREREERQAKREGGTAITRGEMLQEKMYPEGEETKAGVSSSSAPLISLEDQSEDKAASNPSEIKERSSQNKPKFLSAARLRNKAKLEPELTAYEKLRYKEMSEEVENEKAKKEMRIIRREEAQSLLAEKRGLVSRQKKTEQTLRQENTLQQTRFKSEVESLYQEAMDYFRNKNYNLAKIKFSAVEGLVPGYKNARIYINKINKTLHIDEDMYEPGTTSHEDPGLEKPVSPQASDQLAVDLDQLAGLPIKKRMQEVQKVYDEAVRLSEVDALKLSQSKLEQYKRLLANGQFSQDYVAKMSRKANQEQDKIARRLEKEQVRKVEIARKRKENFQHQGKTETLEKQKEIERLRSKVEIEESRLKRAQALQGNRLAKEEGNTETNIPRERLQNKHERIQQEFNETIEKLYQKAIASYKSGQYERAKHLFKEINDLRQGYKNTANYLKQLSKNINSKSTAKKASNPTNPINIKPRTIPDRALLIEQSLDTLEGSLK